MCMREKERIGSSRFDLLCRVSVVDAKLGVAGQGVRGSAVLYVLCSMVCHIEPGKELSNCFSRWLRSME